MFAHAANQKGRLFSSKGLNVHIFDQAKPLLRLAMALGNY
jgi:hypothetical protein